MKTLPPTRSRAFNAPIQRRSAQPRWSPTHRQLISACAGGNEAALSRLLSLWGVDPNWVSAEGLTGLHWASERGHATCVSVLLAAGAVDMPNAHGRTALMTACFRAQKHCAALLLPHSDPLARDKDGATALMLAGAPFRPEALPLLLPVSEIDGRDARGRTALMRACENVSSEAALLLLPHANPTLRDASGASARDIALRSGRDALAAQLLSAEQGWELRRDLPEAIATPSSRIIARI